MGISRCFAWDTGLNLSSDGMLTKTNDPALIPPTIYYSRVGLELSKIVFRGQKMSPP